MAKKRKSEATRLDEVDRTLYSTFCSAANSLSQLYTQAMQHQRLSFHAGERHALEKLYNWMLRQQEDGNRVNPSDIVAYLQHELDYGAEEPPTSQRLPLQQQQSQTSMHIPNSGFPVSSTSFGPATASNGLRSGHSDQQPKNSVFSNALSSPIRRSLQHYHLVQGGFPQNAPPSSAGGTRLSDNNYLQSRDANLQSSNDTSMDMHSDPPDHEFPY
ncbi:PREDICTED: uncharacterized protein LOC109172560 [Ipomoea nil]|uniref:uncharacterized protein LOC109172560 n=1 Tax=Ipomoea nil TaxID=35883 RepID=UPI000901304A|nr:PREDICTED: uncharacterized protein LOC109172560 [Ipomoea nil]